MIRCIGDNKYTGKISIGEAKMDQSNLWGNLIEFSNKTIPKKKKIRKKYFWQCKRSYRGLELTLNAFKSEMFPINATKGKGHPSDLASVDCVTKVSDKFLKT